MVTSANDFSLLQTIDLPGEQGGHGDIVAADPDTGTVWIANSPNDSVDVIDTSSNTVVATVPNVGAANGIAFSPDYAFVVDPTNNTTHVIDKYDYHEVTQVDQTGTTPDGVVYIPSTGEVAVASDDANTLDFINAHSLVQTNPTTQLIPENNPVGPDVPSYDAVHDVIYQPDAGALDVIDAQSHQIVNTFNLLDTGNVKPVVYDPVTNDIIAGTTNNQLLVLNADTGDVLKTIDIPGSVDQSAIDVDHRLAFFADKTGTADVVNLDTNQLVNTLPTESGAHTLDVDPATHNLYVYEGNSNTVDVFHVPTDGMLHA